MKHEGEEHWIGRVAQKALIVKDGKVLLTRNPANVEWELPGGRLNKGEPLEEGLVREVQEEIGARIKPTGVLGVGMFIHWQDGEHVVIAYTATLENPEQELILQKEEIAEIKWVSAEEADSQPLKGGTLEALQKFFKTHKK